MAGDPRLTLYQFPFSYYTQKVLLALYEKKIDFKSVYLSVIANDTLQEWYFKLNPDGRVPLLQDGGTFIPESDDIIDYLEKIQPEPCLVPPSDTDEGKDVSRWRLQLTSDVSSIVNIIYGIYYNPEMSACGIKTPTALTRQAIDAIIIDAREKLKNIALKNPSWKNNVARKLQELDEREAVISNPQILQAKIDGLQLVFDKVENKLKETADGNWLCGKRYSAADISLTVLINRLVLLGLDSLFLTDKRPLVTRFWKNVEGRQNMIELNEFLKTRR